MTSTHTVNSGPARVMTVTAPDCHFCEDASAALAGLGQEYPLAVEETVADSPAGQVLRRQHGTGMFPLVLVDGEFFSAGRLPRRKLARMLARRADVVPVGAGPR